ncbi:MAG: hypothetical protein WCG79_11875 [Verrucomicrobiota bacterium]
MNGTQSDIASGSRVTSLLFEVVQEGNDGAGTQVGDREVSNTSFATSGKLEQQFETVAVTQNRVRTESSLMRQVVTQKTPDGHG